MKVLITGAGGQLGKALVRQFEQDQERYQVLATSHETLDITNEEEVYAYVQALRPEVMINCAAYTAVDAAEEHMETAYAVNAQGPKYLAKACEEIGATLVQVSTDYVFDGVGTIHKKEEDAVNPQSIYGQSKWAGEEAVRKYCTRHFILRTAWLYGEGANFVRTMLKLSQVQPELNVVGDQYGTPTSTKDVAKVIRELIHTDDYGTYHGTCEGECSWYEFACQIFRLKEINIQVNEVTSEAFVRPAPRPAYAVLENHHLKKLGMNHFRKWQEALEDYLEEDRAWQKAHLIGGTHGQD